MSPQAFFLKGLEILCIRLPLHSFRQIEPLSTVCVIRIHCLTLFVIYNYMPWPHHCKIRERADPPKNPETSHSQSIPLILLENRQTKRTHVAEYHRLSYRDGTIDVRQGLELVILVTTLDVILLNVAQTLLFSPQTYCDWVGHNCLRKLHHLSIIGGREEQHLTVLT